MFYLSPAEKKELEDKAKAEGVPLSKFLAEHFFPSDRTKS